MHIDDPNQETNSFPDLRMGDPLDEQIELNQPAMRLLEKWIQRDIETSMDSDEDFKRFQDIIDSNRPPGSNVFSKEP
jgi:hypothetical protein